MKQQRILILGQSKENSYEIRNLLDNKRFELEIALNQDVGKLVLSNRRMNLLIVHTEMVGGEALEEFIEFLEDHEISLPMMLIGEEASQLEESVRAPEPMKCFDKPYPVEEMISYIDQL